MKQILFSPLMVRAIMQGQKTQTRRIVKDRATLSCLEADITNGIETLCPYGKPGEFLWVRETFFAFGKWVKNGFTKTGKEKWRFLDLTLKNGYSYKYEDTMDRNTVPKYKTGWHKRPSLYMPKAACRTFLVIKNSRIERLQTVSGSDAISEGIQFDEEAKGWVDYRKGYEGNVWLPEYPIDSFKSLWETINGYNSWKENPLVWVISFEKCNKPVNFN